MSTPSDPISEASAASETSAAGLEWGPKQSFFEYALGIPDLQIREAGGAHCNIRNRVGLHWPYRGVDHNGYQFTGTIQITGHHGFLHVRLSEPRIQQVDGRWELQFLAGTTPEADYAAVAHLMPSTTRLASTQSWIASLTAHGRQLLGDVYPVGEELDTAYTRTPAPIET